MNFKLIKNWMLWNGLTEKGVESSMCHKSALMYWIIYTFFTNIQFSNCQNDESYSSSCRLFTFTLCFVNIQQHLTMMYLHLLLGSAKSSNEAEKRNKLLFFSIFILEVSYFMFRIISFLCSWIAKNFKKR